MWIIYWVIFSFVAGAVGSGRKVGFLGAFLLSIILSPFIGLIIAFSSKNKNTDKFEKSMLELETQKKYQEMLKQRNQENKRMSLTEELEKIKTLKENGFITDEEYQKLKTKIINN